MYRIRSVASPKVRLLASGTILREASAAADLLQQDFGVAADVYSVTSYIELRRDAMVRDHTSQTDVAQCTSWVGQQLPPTGAPIVAASDYVAAVPDLIRAWVRDDYIALGTDGFGRSDTRAALRKFFKVDQRSIALAALSAIGDTRARSAAERWDLDE